jgi:hypothetical protein
LCYFKKVGKIKVTDQPLAGLNGEIFYFGASKLIIKPGMREIQFREALREA